MMSGKLSYANKVVLAPMVRIGTLPMRRLALRNSQWQLVFRKHEKKKWNVYFQSFPKEPQ